MASIVATSMVAENPSRLWLNNLSEEAVAALED